MTAYSKSITYETGANGDAATTTNLQCDTLRFTSGAGTAAISTAQFHSGTRSMHFTSTSTSGLYSGEDYLGGLAQFTRDFWVYVAALPATGTEVTLSALLDTGLVSQAKLGLNGLGALIARQADGTSVYSGASGHRITAASWFHIIWDVGYGASGTQRVRLTGAASDDSTTVASNNGAALLTYHRRGSKAATATATVDLYYDDEALTGTGTGTANAGVDQTVEPGDTVTLDASGSSATGTWSISSNTSTTTPTLTTVSSYVSTFTAPGDWHVGSALRLRYTLGDGTSDDVIITINPATIGVITNAGTGTVQALRMTPV